MANGIVMVNGLTHPTKANGTTVNGIMVNGATHGVKTGVIFPVQLTN